MTTSIVVGDCCQALSEMQAASARCCVTSPPYWGLRDYGVAGQLGMEPTPEEYVAKMVAVFRAVRRVLTDDGTLWLNLGDSYAANRSYQVTDNKHVAVGNDMPMRVPDGLKPKDLIGIPWRVAFALQADGWHLRSDVIWAKPNPMPESVTDRPTKSHEYVFLLSKSARYYYDADAIAEPAINAGAVVTNDAGKNSEMGKHGQTRGGFLKEGGMTVGDTRNARTVWTITTKPFKGAHFATMPPELAERCIKAGSARGDTVLDPFAGAGTTLLVADRLGRNGVGIELNPTYAEMARLRITDDAPLFTEV